MDWAFSIRYGDLPLEDIFFVFARTCRVGRTTKNGTDTDDDGIRGHEKGQLLFSIKFNELKLIQMRGGC